VNDELEWFRKEAIVIDVMYYSGTSVCTTGVPADIQTEQLPNISFL
jgi:hypothetical protein